MIRVVLADPLDCSAGGFVDHIETWLRSVTREATVEFKFESVRVPDVWQCSRFSNQRCTRH